MYSAANKTNQGVTIIVWPSIQENNKSSLLTSSSATILNDGISFGHAALRTYSGGLNGNGCYLSFWGGRSDCGCGYNDCEHPHFHTISDDDEEYYKDSVLAKTVNPDKVHLDIVNLEAVNQKILEIVSSKGRIWGFQQNCSDLVLEALRAGVPDFSSLIYRSPYGWKTIFSLSMLIGFIIPEFIDSYWMISNFKYAKKFYDENPEFNEDITCPSLSEWLLGLLQITPSNRYFIPAINIVKSIVGSMFSYPLIYIFSLFTNSKYQEILYYERINIAKTDALKAFLFVISEPIFFELLKNLANFYEKEFPAYFFLKENIVRFSIILNSNFKKILIENIISQENVNSYSTTLLYLSIPSLWALAFLLQKHYYDTTVTPNYVLKLAKDLKSEQEENSNNVLKLLAETKPIAQNIFYFFNRKIFLVTGSVLVSSALFFYGFSKLGFAIDSPKPKLI